MRFISLAQPTARSPQIGAFVWIVLVLVAWRLTEFVFPRQIPPNFTPMLATALFAGSTLQRRATAYAVPLAAMVLSDLVIGFSRLSPLVYALIAASVWAGVHALSVRPHWTRVLLMSIASATGFFVITNLAVWACFDLYPHTFDGLLAAYVAALPFYTHGTLAGTVFFALVLFSLHPSMRGTPLVSP